jgi:hypothetical protein
MKKSYIIFFLLTLFIIIFTFSAFAQFVRVTSEFANIRLMPDTESIIIGKAFENDIFGYEGEGNDWIKINMFSGEHRYIHHNLVKVINYGISAPFSNDICQSLTKRLEEAEDRSLIESDNRYPLSNGENMEKNNEYQRILLDRYILEVFREYGLQPVVYQIAVIRCFEGSHSKIGQRPAVKSEFKIIEEKDISIKALGEKKPSDYSLEELEKLPTNIRMRYLIVVPSDITLEELKSQLAQVIMEKSNANPDIDEIYVGAWESEESFKGGNPNLGYAEWSPYGEWSVMPPEIARNNNRDTYKIVYHIDEKALEAIKKRKIETLFGLSEEIRKEIFTEIVKCEDWSDREAMQYYYPGCEDCANFIVADIYKYIDKSRELIDSCEENIRKKYNITEEIMLKISVEALEERWVMPEMLPMPDCCR